MATIKCLNVKCEYNECGKCFNGDVTIIESGECADSPEE